MNIEKDIITAAVRLLENKSVITVGIDGLGGAGKSTVSDKICEALSKEGIHTVLLHIDDFIHVRSIRYNSEYPEWQCYYEMQWRYDYFREVVNELKKVGGTVETELYDKDNDSYLTEKICTKERTVIITEGIFLQRDELAGIFDLMAYIDVPEDERLNRVIGRDTYIGNEQEIVSKYENRYFPAERKYFERYRPDLKSDILIKDKGSFK